MKREKVLVGLQGATALAAVAALVFVLLLGPRFSNVEHRVHEVKEQVVTLRLPAGVKAHVMTTTRKGVMPGAPEPHVPHVHLPGGRPAPARRRRPCQGKRPRGPLRCPA